LRVQAMRYPRKTKKTQIRKDGEQHMSEHAIQGIVCVMLSGGIGIMLAIIVHLAAHSFRRAP